MKQNDAENSFSVETLADKVIETLAVSSGQVIWIWASTYSLDLVEALAFRIRARGAFWTLRLTMESLLRRMGHHLPERYLGLIPQHELRWLADISAIVSVRDHGGHVPGVPLVRRRKMGAEWIALIDEATRRGCRQIMVVNPTSALAAACGVPLAALRQAYWQALNIDHAALAKRQERTVFRLLEARQIHITSALGTDLRLRNDHRPIHLDKDSIPCGEVYVAPREDSAEGIAVIDRVFLRGKPVEKLRLTFVGGHLTRIEGAGSSAEALQELLAASSGDKDVIAEFAIGLNPGIREPVGDIMLDEKIGGSIHIAIGENKRFGGQNQSNLHLDLIILRPTVRLDGSVIIDNGILSL